jgi:hypothetical protein
MSPTDFYDTNVLPKKFVTDANLLTENIFYQPDRTNHSLKKKHFPKPTSWLM